MNRSAVDNQLLGHSLSKLLFDRSINIFYAFIYCGLLIVIYYFYIVQYWAYLGFNWNPSNQNLAFSIIFITLISIFTPIKANVRSILLTICSYMHFFPSIVLFYASGTDLNYFVILLIGILPIYMFSFIPMKRIVFIELPWKDILLICASISLITLILIIYYAGIGNFNLSLSEVYAYRAAANENMPAFIGYMRPMTTKVFLPIMVIISFFITAIH